MQNKLREIRSSLRLAMNGVTSNLMREKGMDYRFNFGVDIPRLRRLAEKYAPDQDLAEALWREEVRELKILATLVYPPERLVQADDWAASIANQELAEQASMNLFSKMPSAKAAALRWIRQEPLYVRLSGFLTITRLMMRGETLSAEENRLLLTCSADAYYAGGSLLLKTAVLNTLFRVAQQGEAEQALLSAYLSDKEELWELLR